MLVQLDHDHHNQRRQQFFSTVAFPDRSAVVSAPGSYDQNSYQRHASLAGAVRYRGTAFTSRSGRAGESRNRVEFTELVHQSLAWCTSPEISQVRVSCSLLGSIPAKARFRFIRRIPDAGPTAPEDLRLLAASRPALRRGHEPKEPA